MSNRNLTRRVSAAIILALPLTSALDTTNAQSRFRRGDPNDDGTVQLADVTHVLFRWFHGVTDRTTCEDAADMNDDGRLNLSDPVFLLNHLFLGGPPLPPPTGDACGLDSTPDDLGCVSFGSCPALLEGDVNSLGMAFVRLPAGTFVMGSPESERGRNNDEFLHEVTISCDFDIQATEVTQRQFLEIMGRNPSTFQGPDAGDNLDRPVESVTWSEARAFCRRLSDREREATGEPVRYRLPTEAEWEYACRAETRTRFWFGDLLECRDDASSCGAADPFMWWFGNMSEFALTFTQPVATKPANPWGLYDMHGNTREWCLDWYGPYPRGHVTDPTGPFSGANKVTRGRAIWQLSQGRSAWRGKLGPHDREVILGFRVVREITGCHLPISD